jgi:hypothetical protein
LTNVTTEERPMTLIFEVCVPGLDEVRRELVARLIAERLRKRGGGVFAEEFVVDGACVYAKTITDNDGRRGVRGGIRRRPHDGVGARLAPIMDAAERVDLGRAIEAAVIAYGYMGRLWTQKPDSAASRVDLYVRVYAWRRVSKGTQDIGYVDVLPDGSRDYAGLTRNKAGVRDAVERALAARLATP